MYFIPVCFDSDTLLGFQATAYKYDNISPVTTKTITALSDMRAIKVKTTPNLENKACDWSSLINSNLL